MTVGPCDGTFGDVRVDQRLALGGTPQQTVHTPHPQQPQNAARPSFQAATGIAPAGVLIVPLKPAHDGHSLTTVWPSLTHQVKATVARTPQGGSIRHATNQIGHQH